jgi:hypothetical protein
LPSPVGARCARPPSSAGVPPAEGSRPSDPRARAARPYGKQSNGSVSAGHGVHRSDSIHHRDHRGHREGTNTHSAGIIRPVNHHSSVISVPSVVNLSPAGHGLHRSIRDHLRSSASICGSNPLAPAPMPNFVLQSAAALR